MEFDHDNVRRVEEEDHDRLSSLSDELIHQILSQFDMKFVVQTCLLSSRWKLLWTSMPYLNFSSTEFDICHYLYAFVKFVTHVLSHRNHQIQLSSLNLYLYREPYQDILRKILDYAFSHNVQQLDVDTRASGPHAYPSSLFSSQSLKHLTLLSCHKQSWITPTTTPWDFPALTSLHLRGINLYGDIFSNMNLKKLTLHNFHVSGVEVFDITTPRLSTLILNQGACSKVINLVAPELENLTIINCSIRHLNAPPGLSSFCYKGCGHLPLMSKYGFHSLNKVNICWAPFCPRFSVDGDVCEVINMLQVLHSVRYLTLGVDLVEYISKFPDVLSQHSSPFSNLICLTIDASISMKEGWFYTVDMCAEARNFLLESSPNATLNQIMVKTIA